MRPYHRMHHAPMLRMLLCGALGVALWPRPALASCGPLDIASCMDGVQYTLWSGVAKNLWAFDRSLLQLTYSINQLRWWIVDSGFGFMYTLLQGVFGPLLGPVATIAILLALLSFILSPLVGRLQLVNLRHAMLWLFIGPYLLATAGTMLVQAEEARTYVTGVILSQGAGAITDIPAFGAAATDMPPPVALYAGSPNPCGTGALTRRDPGVRPDDLAAALVGADAQDIHCPNAVGPSSTLPDAFCDSGSRVYFAECDAEVGTAMEFAGGQAAVDRMQNGVTRLLITVIPGILAVLDALVQLVLALALVALFLALPVGLVVVYFQQTAGGVTSLFRRGIGVFQVSWSTSAILGIVLVCLRATAELGNATAYAGFAAGALVLTGYFLIMAFQTLSQSIRTVNDTVLMTTGLSVTAPVDLARQTAGAGMAVASGGTSLALGTGAALVGGALAGAAAQRATGNTRYALGAAAGRVAPALVQVGAVAAAMGRESDTLDGVYAGFRARRSPVAARTAYRADAARKDAQGLTLRDRASESQIAREVRSMPRQLARMDDAPATPTYMRVGAQTRVSREPAPTTAVRVGTQEARVERLLMQGYRVQRADEQHYAVWNPSTRPAARSADPRIAEAEQRLQLTESGALRGDVQTAQQQLEATRSVVAQEQAQQDAAAAAAPAQARDAAQQQQAANVTTLRAAIGPTIPLRQPRTGGAVTVADADVPTGPVWTAPTDTVRADRLLALGYAVRDRNDGTTAFWHPTSPTDAATADTTARFHRAHGLVAAGALADALDLDTGPARMTTSMPLVQAEAQAALHDTTAALRTVRQALDQQLVLLTVAPQPPIMDAAITEITRLRAAQADLIATAQQLRPVARGTPPPATGVTQTLPTLPSQGNQPPALPQQQAPAGVPPQAMRTMPRGSAGGVLRRHGPGNQPTASPQSRTSVGTTREPQDEPQENAQEDDDAP